MKHYSFLVEHGEAVTVPCEDGFVHYDANTKPHLHFQCRRCKCLIDITNPSDNEILENNCSKTYAWKIIFDKCVYNIGSWVVFA